ncbi:hypothetical protein PN483_06045 [Nodularia spumigena CS-591/04]|uniref:hypothetical protein n=1 Tax=Nodularia spumigena TaxID=70799 RepID=UPI00232EF8DB|nr:hypothetical protein [Nodularia spumigena]MDB9322754.1 hypothetical protein [Nodularia spumigena CS-591/07A]MDB9330053.1 hypothetical protein [Nodularia spumigena CS-591/04]MDB9360660.1 hypothetical protein [Nodularia spumigena CS-588/02]MDB9365376.1 hypothetical protein [Nodularia spumigena CS-588/02A10]
MNILYSIEPDICIINPDILINFPLDIVLPQYFLTQINHLSNSDFGNATESANTIINSLNQWEDSDLLLFKTNAEGRVYFIDESINYLKVDSQYQYIDNTNLLDRYLLSLLYLSNILEVKIVFLASSPEIINKCRILNFDTVTLAEFTLNGESWLQPEMLVNVESSNPDIFSEPNILNTSEIETTIPIQWQDIRVSQGTNNIQWLDIR